MTLARLMHAALPGLSALLMAAGAGSQDLPPQGAPAAPPPHPEALHFVLDASGSMCGYLRPSDPNGPLLAIIRRAAELKDDEKGERLLLIRHKGPTPATTAQLAVRDLIDAPPDLQGMLNNANGRVCAPFDGDSSNMDLLFETQPKRAPARSLVLVSDMVLSEEELGSFVDHFRQWLRAQRQDQFVSAGIATLASQFVGNYYSETDPDADKRRAGYQLPQHVRPLNVLWFVAGEEDARIVRQLLQDLGALQPQSRTLLNGLQVFPVQTSDPQRWLQPLPPLRSSALMFGRPHFGAVAPYSQRDPRVLQDCPRWQWREGTLAIDVRGKCRDGHVFFDGVEEIDVFLPIDGSRGMLLAPSPGATVRGAEMVVPVARSAAAASTIVLNASAAEAAYDAAKLNALTLDNDTCATQPARAPAGDAPADWKAACVRKMNGKVYQYDVLVRRFAARAVTVMNERLADPRNRLSLTIQLIR